MTVCEIFESLLFPRAMEQRAPWKSSRWNRVQHFGRTERFDGCSHLYEIAPYEARYSLPGVPEYQTGRWWGEPRIDFVAPRATSAQSDALGPLEDCSGLRMVHIEMAAAVESFGSTEMLDSIPGTWSPGDEPGDPAGEKSYHTSSPPCSLSFLPGAKVLDKVTERATPIAKTF